MLILHQYPSVWGLPSLSPFCIKVEAYLKMTALPYQVVIQNNPKRGPKGKFPVLEDKGKLIPDSSFIIDYLNKQYNPSMAILDPAALGMQRLIEEHLYFIILYSRWVDKKGIKIIYSDFSGFFPKPIAFLALTWIRKQLTKQAIMQGIARHSKEEVYAQGVQDIAAVAAWLGNKTYCLGKELNAIDATVYAFMRTIQLSPLENPLKDALQAHPNLIDYCDRISLNW
ncbi:Outer mitochondrial membrane transport complex protein [Legionella beliardensis]|uniref:Outer mitochondrial membrane transport complex protein n=1 Tax=Legionella beliardensis TaxID=91822 RepID=A0A378I2K9_9GAMM|nr:glutathione S-transferase family protein [Legionella beliardensis]STX29398.1 Outer mitochondrial membrane transport complex protein [Legionella beliardensis]